LKSKISKGDKEVDNFKDLEEQKLFKKFVYTALLEEELKIPIHVTDLEIHLSNLNTDTITNFKERLQCSLIPLLEELEHKHGILHIDTLVVSEKKRLVIGKLDRNKLRILNVAKESTNFTTKYIYFFV